MMTPSSCTWRRTGRAEPRIAEIHAVHVRIDLHARMPSFLTQAPPARQLPCPRSAAHGAQADDRSGHVATISARRSLTIFEISQPEAGLRPVGKLVRRRDTADIDAHAVHVLEPHLDGRELGPAVLHLLT